MPEHPCYAQDGGRPVRITGRQRGAAVVRLSGQAGDIMQAARTCFERDGVRATTVTAVAAEAGITRELFYYYFASKQAVIDAVLDDYVADLVETVLVWNELRVFGDTPASLRKGVRALRLALYDADGPRPMVRVLEELGQRDAFDVRAVRETVDCINEHIVTEYAAYHQVEIDFVREMFCVVLFGLVGLLKVEPEVSDEVLMRIVEQTLRLDMRVIEHPAERTVAPDAAWVGEGQRLGAEPLEAFFARTPRLAVAFSGGADSSYLLAAARAAGCEVGAYLVSTAFQPAFELADARAVAARVGVPLRVIEADVLSQADICANPPDRCRLCKRFIFARVWQAARADGFSVLADGTNASDDPARRPGFRSLDEAGVTSPLRRAGLAKADVRAASRALAARAGLPADAYLADKPRFSCLATHVP
ncbi:TetR family transcriptional regulator, partial [Adlercreutzia sp. ZJ473]|uniref:TetR family transcriptional regulator n=1 Tax=Adlercreutzia sp. ZJ473 TaxID=2722822 RepID=UPI0020A651E9